MWKFILNSRTTIGALRRNQGDSNGFQQIQPVFNSCGMGGRQVVSEQSSYKATRWRTFRAEFQKPSADCTVASEMLE